MLHVWTTESGHNHYCKKEKKRKSYAVRRDNRNAHYGYIIAHGSSEPTAVGQKRSKPITIRQKSGKPTTIAQKSGKPTTIRQKSGKSTTIAQKSGEATTIALNCTKVVSQPLT